MKYLCIWLIRGYQKFLSPLKLQPSCRFTPTCSAYAIQAFQKRGFVIGFILTVYRILRCQPFCVGGYDPVPEKGLKHPRYRARPMTKYYYPEEYGLEPDGDTVTSTNDSLGTAR